MLKSFREGEGFLKKHSQIKMAKIFSHIEGSDVIPKNVPINVIKDPPCAIIWGVTGKVKERLNRV